MAFLIGSTNGQGATFSKLIAGENTRSGRPLPHREDARLRLRLARRDVIARVQVTNLFNTYRWIANSSEGLTYNSGRYVSFSLATDLES